ncbi:Rgg/GadR/MutR family transcriptional regulator [Staphylococcus pseudintermedius]|uniref:Rgg/GadR/MutR family transcriptional regulator n=1 Tax=Staphylococcus pseudintermedius TaxID=283734 RepID=UPI002B25A5BD|nr:helix-turn-helix domain-containing protein [Staphylococcus pseudintermedius]WQJ33207.1 helix-turn-helix domain-containing protein [Staphylococcus pseudintermedius]
MKNYGKTFRKIRKSRGIKLKDIAKMGISVSQLSRFENGETNLTISKFILILNEIMMPLDEFMNEAHDFRNNRLNERFEHMIYFTIENDILRMKQLLVDEMKKNTQRSHFYYLNLILIKIRLQVMTGELYYTKDDLEVLIDYLFTTEYWGYYELYLFTNTLDVINHETMMLLSREIVSQTKALNKLQLYRRMLSAMLLNGYMTCIQRQKMKDAIFFKKCIERCLFTETEIYEKLVFQYAKHFFIYSKSSSEDAINKMKKIIEVMRLVESHHIASYYENHLNHILCEKNVHIWDSL